MFFPQIFVRKTHGKSSPKTPQNQWSRSSPSPPPGGWHVPWDGPVDPSLKHLGLGTWERPLGGKTDRGKPIGGKAWGKTVRILTDLWKTWGKNLGK